MASLLITIIGCLTNFSPVHSLNHQASMLYSAGRSRPSADISSFNLVFQNSQQLRFHLECRILLT